MESSDKTTAPTSKKVFMPMLIGVGIAFNFFIIMLLYGPRKRGSWLETTLNPSHRDPFEQWKFSTLSPEGQTLCLTVTLISFVVGSILMYKYLNRPKMDKNEDVE